MPAIRPHLPCLSKATQSLSRFNLDYDRGTVGHVSVNGRRAAFSQSDEELVVTPSRSLRRGSTFLTVVHYTPDPLAPLDGESYTNIGWSLAAESSIVWAQPNAAHDVYPSNDHPSDKASFSFHLDVPAGTTAIANGALLSERTWRGRTRSHYLMSKPMATELTQIAVGAYERSSMGRHRGVHIRNATEPAVADVANPAFARIPEHLEWTEETLGLRYPFEQYGGLVFNAPVPGAVETQTISSYGSFWFDYPLPLWDEVFVHELAHEWFGNSVTPARWKDVWLNESHATYYEHLYGEPRGGLDAWYGISTRSELYEVVHELQPQWREEFGPPGAPVGSQVGASLKSLVGGELKGMTKMLAEGREHVTERLVEEAEAKGANAIIAFRFDTSELGSTWTEICAYETVVKASKR
jgi:aminopeptidase N/uncharacterized protein YbjQ (UPF0145 family)